MCREREETVSHLVAECTSLAQKYFKAWRHDKVAQVIHWDLSEKFGMKKQQTGMTTNRSLGF